MSQICSVALLVLCGILLIVHFVSIKNSTGNNG